MCGICGVVGGDSTVEARWVRAMTTAIAHRGPDDEGVQVDHPAVLGNRRLAILDLSPAGHQPLGGDALGAWITYNGEIYNHAALRSELTAAGHQFHGTSDTEVVLAMYREHGPSFVSRLRGMFALAIWDRRRQRLFCARDHFGQKPFFYTEIGGRLLFASEIKALLAHPDVTREPEPAAIDYYLSLRMIPPPLTMFRGIRKLPAGHWLQWSADEGVATGAYWVPTPPASVPRSDGEWVDAIRGALTGAVESHRVSDVQVGAYLSGGLDSSVVVALLSRHGQERIPTFCVGSASPTFDERPQARIVASHCRTDHHESVASVALLHELPHLVGALDEPSDPIAACFDAAARLAATHVKVVLGGDWNKNTLGLQYVSDPSHRARHAGVLRAHPPVDEPLQVPVDHGAHRARVAAAQGQAPARDRLRHGLRQPRVPQARRARDGHRPDRERGQVHPKHFEVEGVQAEDVRVGNALELPFPDESFDAVWSNGVLHATGDTQRAINEVWRVLKPGGRAIISHFYRKPSWMWTVHRLGREPIEAHEEDPPVNEFYTDEEVLAMFSRFKVLEAAHEHHRALPVAKRGIKAALYRGVFAPLYNLLPESVALRYAYKISVTAIKARSFS
jgi:asparagine synthase (glutamine-hydrolysing)